MMPGPDVAAGANIVNAALLGGSRHGGKLVGAAVVQ